MAGRQEGNLACKNTATKDSHKFTLGYYLSWSNARKWAS